MTQHDQQKEPGRAQSIAVAAALAILGVSVGVNVQDLFAASPAETMQADPMKPGTMQSKGPAIQDKLPSVQEKGAVQQKLPAFQQKQPVMPGLKPGDPLR